MHSHLPSSIVALCALGLLASCAESESDPCYPGSEPSLLVGHGELEYAEVGDDEVELIHGPQGGYHINVALQATHLDASQPLLTVLSGEIGGEVIGETQPYATLRCNRQVNAQQSWGLLLIWDAEPEDLHEQVASVDVSIIDASGTELTASTELTIYDPILD